MCNLQRIEQSAIIEKNLRYGISSLHALIKFLECILHIAYKLQLQQSTTHGATEEERQCIEERKKCIQMALKQKLGIRVDVVIPGGNSNTGNVARKL